MKALRGTKRLCQACAARFYDLSREPIVCPSCGAHYVPDAPPMAPEVGTRAARFTDKTGRRGRPLKHADPESDGEAEGAPTADGNEEPLVPSSNEHAMLDEEPDEADISGVVGHDELNPEER